MPMNSFGRAIAKAWLAEEPVAWFIETEQNSCLVQHISLDKPSGKTWMRWPIRRIEPLYFGKPVSEASGSNDPKNVPENPGIDLQLTEPPQEQKT